MSARGGGSSGGGGGAGGKRRQRGVSENAPLAHPPFPQATLTCCVCHAKCAIALSALKARRSQIEKEPSSAPLASRYDTRRDQESTLTSQSAPGTLSMERAATRVSQMRSVLSALHDANTVASLGDHCRSSTLPVWPTKRRSASPLHTLAARLAAPPAATAAAAAAVSGSHTWMPPAQSPDARRPGVTGDQSSA